MTSKDHYVPEFYLKGFVDPVTDKLWVVDSKILSVRPDAPRNAARISGYDNLQGNTTKDRLIASNVLKAIENKAAPALAKLREQSLQLSIDDKDNLSNFIGQQIGRVPIFRDFINIRMDQVPNEILRAKVLSAEFENKYGKDAAMIRQRVLSGKYPAHFKFKEPFDRKDGVLLTTVMLGQKLSSLIFGMNWLFLVTNASEGFITSDNPANLLFLNGELPTIDFNNPTKNLEISIPISSSCILLAHYHDESEYRHKYIFVDISKIDEFNKRLVRTAHRYIFCSSTLSIID